MLRGIGTSDGDVHRADRFFWRAARWTSDAGDADSPRGVEPFACAVRERDRNLFRHFAVRLDQIAIDIRKIRLRVAGVSDDAAHEVTR